MGRLTTLGKVVAGCAIAACAAIAVLLVAVVAGAGEGAVIALAAAPIALAIVPLIWPAARLREPPKVPTLPPRPASSVEEHDETLGQLLEAARDQAKVEEDRQTAIAARAGWLLGFAGVILALAGTQAKNVFESAASLGSVGRPLGTWFLIAAAVMTAVAAACALGALLPRPSVRITTSQLAGFLEPEIYGHSRGDIRYARLRALVETIAKDRASNERGMDWIGAGFTALLAALLLLLLHLGVYLERSVDSPCARASRSAPLSYGVGGWDQAARQLQAKARDLLPDAVPKGLVGKLAVLDPPSAFGTRGISGPARGSDAEVALVGSRPPPCFDTEEYDKSRLETGDRPS